MGASLEENRLNSLLSYQVMDSLPEIDFDDITLLASQVCNTKYSYICFIDDEKQWFKSTVGFQSSEIPKEYSICNYAINKSKEPLIIENLLEHDIFYSHPMVTGEQQIRFYASAPLVNESGYALGTICVLDKKERRLTKNQIKGLQALARQVVKAIEIRKSKFVQDKNISIQSSKNEAYKRFAYNTLDKISSPLNSISLSSEMINNAVYNNDLDKVLKYAQSINKSVVNVINHIEELQKTHKVMDLISREKERINLAQFVASIFEEGNKTGKQASYKFLKEANVFFENKFLLKKIIEETIRVITAVNVNEVTYSFSMEKYINELKIVIKDNSKTSIDIKETREDFEKYLSAAKWRLNVLFEKDLGHTIEITLPRF